MGKTKQFFDEIMYFISESKNYKLKKIKEQEEKELALKKKKP